ncbi:MAG: hypothetical protein ACXABK_00065 [Candidatus Heimdallarchaeaceae archaeon]|jgi:hypothetical protein
MKPASDGMLCPICKITKDDRSDIYCNSHVKAKQHLQKGYESWLKAYSLLAWEDFLKQLLDLGDLVGALIRDVVEFEFYFKQ